MPLVVYDDCGAWPTFVGGGPAAWGTTQAAGTGRVPPQPQPNPSGLHPTPGRADR